MQLPHVNKKTTSENTNFASNTVFSLYFKTRVKKISRCKTTHFFAPLLVSAKIEKHCFTMPHVNKKICSRTEFSFHTSISCSIENIDINKNHSLFAPLFILFSNKIFSRVLFPASKFTPKILIKKGLLQHCSSSRKKRQHPKKGELLNNSR